MSMTTRFGVPKSIRWDADLGPRVEFATVKGSGARRGVGGDYSARNIGLLDGICLAFWFVSIVP